VGEKNRRGFSAIENGEIARANAAIESTRQELGKREKAIREMSESREKRNEKDEQLWRQ
jgi:hypothetical protein